MSRWPLSGSKMSGRLLLSLWHRLRRTKGENLVQQCFGLVLVGLLGQGQFADEDLPRLGEHALLAGGQTALLVPAPEVTDDLRHLVDVARGELLQVGLVTTRPVGRFLGVRGAEHFEHALEPFLANNVTNADELRVIR